MTPRLISRIQPYDDCVTRRDNDAGRQRELRAQALEQRCEGGETFPESRRRTSPRSDDRDGLNHRGLHFPFQLDVFFEVNRQPFENGSRIPPASPAAIMFE